MEHIRDISAFKSALSLSKEILSREYLGTLKTMALTSSPDTAQISSVQLIELGELSESSAAKILSKMIPSLAALHHLETSIGYLLQISSDKITIYLALKNITDSTTALKLIENVLNTECLVPAPHGLPQKEAHYLLQKSLFNPDCITSLASIIVNPIAFCTADAAAFSKLNALFQAMRNQEYTLLFLASPTAKKQVNDTIYQLENLFTLLDTFKETTFTSHHTVSGSCTNSVGSSKSKSLSETHSESTTQTTAKELACKNTDSLFINCKVNDNLNYIINNQPFKAEETKNICALNSTASHTVQNTLSDTTNDSDTNTKGNNSTYFFKGENKTAIELLKKNSDALTALYHSQFLPQFNLGIYFLAPQLYTTLQGAFTYLDLFTNTKDCMQENYVTTWDNKDACFNTLLEHLSILSHPCFARPRNKTYFTPTSLIDSKSLAQLICIPAALS